MTLDELVRTLDVATATGDLSRPVERVVHDSRDAGPDDVFVAIRGGRVDGRDFVPGLRVAAVIADAEVEVPPGVSLVRVPDARRALSRAAAAVAGFPSRKLDVVGVTGTNGKTTVTWMVEAIATHAGRVAGVIGTTGHRIGGRTVLAQHTTPEAPVLQDLLRRMVQEGCSVAAMEISSIGLALHRADDVRLAAGVFTSFSQDHLDFHLTMEAYLHAKLRLFSDLLRRSGTAVICGTDRVADEVAEACGKRRVWRYGLRPDLDLHAVEVEQRPAGIRALVHTPEGEGRLVLPMPGLHNLENALGAIGASLALGVPLADCLGGLERLPPVPGRLQPVVDPSGERVVVVDYAHTPDALARALAAARKLGTGRLHVVFGCGGDRDQAKRPAMGHVASIGADRLWLTSDNPRSEDPQAILDAILAGVPDPDPARVQVIVDRGEAITAAIEAAASGDVVLLAGKGHELTQELAGRVVPFDDRDVARQALARRNPQSRPEDWST